MARDPRDIDDATLRLLLAPGIGPATVRALRARFGSDAEAVVASEQELAQVPGVGPPTASAIRLAIAATRPDAERASMTALGVRLLLRGDRDYPRLLDALPAPPEALWVRGELRAAECCTVAIVGSRRSTPYGQEQGARLAALLSQSGLTVVSGGAAGIDAAAHRGVLRVGGRTIAVMGCGLATCYPHQHAQLFERIVDSGGALVSEHPMEVPPVAGNFPRRNRVISGLSLGVLVIEAARRSGALITARLAAEEHGREVMALPGRVDSPASAGCHQLIQDGGAALVTSHADVLRQLEGSSQPIRAIVGSAGGDAPTVSSGDGGNSCGPKRATLLDLAMTSGQRAVLKILEEASDPLSIEVVAASAERPLSEVMADVTLLEIRACIARDHRGLRIRAGCDRPRGEPGPAAGADAPC